MANKVINREKTIIRTSIIGIIANIFLVGFKAFVGFVAGSISIIMDAVNNLTDALSSVITIIGTKIAGKKPDKKHPFGHGRVEYITSTLIAFLILFAGGVAIYQSIVSIVDFFTHIDNPTLPYFDVISFIIISVAILVKVGICIFYKIQGKRVQSEALKASGTDALFDALLSTATLVGMILATTLHWYVEGFLGILIGAFIIKSGIEILISSFSSIVGERYDADIVKDIIKDITSIPGVLGAYDLIINNYGHNRNIGSVHVGVSSDMTAIEIQQLERNINELMYSKYHTFMTVGIYAECNDTPEGKNIYDCLFDLITNYKTILQMHGFFVDIEKKVCNFDLVISFDEKEPEKVINEIKTKLKEQFPEYTFAIIQDSDYSLS